ncbi:MAG: ATP-dependent Clp protease proteolytic subunit [Phycisphaerales bacterium]|nr:ATP-dependent Clp protease proteolytic subunit [Phycisphaerales bacterium]
MKRSVITRFPGPLLLLGLVVMSGLAAAPAPTAPVPAWRQATDVAVLPITGPIDQVTATSLNRRLKQAMADGAQAIVFEIDTPGGELMATLEICRMIKYDAPANTIAWIHPYAFSAGTIIALACREIVVSPDATFGDSAPVSPLGPIPLAERAKLEAPILAEVIDSARRRHYDEQLVQAFVSVGVELWLLRNTTTGELIFVDQVEYESLFGTPPPEQMVQVDPGQLEGEMTFSPLFEALAEADTTPDVDSIAYEQLLPSSRPRLDAAAQGEWSLVGQVIADDRLLTLKPGEAKRYGLVASTVNDQAELQALLGATTIRYYRQSWSESFVQFLVSWPVRIVLVIIFLVCIFVEMTFPGTGLFAGGSLIAMALLVGAPALAGMAEWWDLLAVLLGLGLIAMEILLMPGTLIAGITGAILLMVGIIGTFVSGDMTDGEMQQGIIQGILVVLTGAFLSGLIIWYLSRHIHKGQLGRGFVLRAQLGEGDSHAVTTVPHSEVPIGTIGRSETALRPAGRIWIDDELMDAVSLGRWIDAGVEVRVVKTGLVLEVEATDP